jgi:CDP-diacylglycerol--glycerol-3-phosphate 3-phosphatidyltransferase
VAYYLFVAGIHIRKRQNKPVYPLAPSKLRRTLAGFQMGYVAVVLWPPFAANVSALAGFGFMLPLLGGFLVDWGVVSGRINPNESKTSRLLHRMNLSTNAVVLPALRLALIPALFYIAIQAQWHNVSVAIAGISVLMITLGLAGRAGAMVLLMLLAWTVPMPVYAPVFVLMLFIAITIVLLGCGRYSWWQADDDWVNRQDGA